MDRRIQAFAVALGAAVLLCSFDADARGKKRKAPLPRIPSVLRGTEEALARENRLADANGLPRFKDRAELEKAVADGILTPLLDTDAYAIDGELGEEDPDNAELYANTQAWTRMFLDDVLGEGHKKFGLRFAITSLARTQEYQDTLRESNAAAADGRTSDSRSTHLTGATVDISLVGMSWRAKQWFRKRLIELEKKGLIQATEERHQYCMHILVLPGYEDAVHPTEPAR
jgi:hypothetical protein